MKLVLPCLKDTILPVWTDYLVLCWILTVTEATEIFDGWRHRLLQIDLHILRQAETKHQAADTLSWFGTRGKDTAPLGGEAPVLTISLFSRRAQHYIVTTITSSSRWLKSWLPHALPIFQFWLGKQSAYRPVLQHQMTTFTKLQAIVSVGCPFLHLNNQTNASLSALMMSFYTCRIYFVSCKDKCRQPYDPRSCTSVTISLRLVTWSSDTYTIQCEKKFIGGMWQTISMPRYVISVHEQYERFHREWKLVVRYF